MSKIRFAGPLNAARWPLVAAIQGRTVINPIYDPVSRAARQFFGTDESDERYIPQLVYCENVVPMAQGLNSVGYRDLINPSAFTDFDQAIILRDTVENNYLYSPANGKNYILDIGTGLWNSVDPIIGLPVNTNVTYGYVNGRTFVCFSGNGVYEYDVTGGNFVKVTMTWPPGVVEADILGIGASNNYLIAFANVAIGWSSLIDPTDFTPSPITGAGYATPQDVRGKIVAAIGASGGFIIWTTRNAVAATYTNNVRAPFAFKEISNSGGVNSTEHITADAVSGVHYSWSNAGLQKVTLQSAEPLSGEVSDFLAGRMFNTWNSTTKQLDLTLSDLAEFYVKLVYIGNRYLCVSWSETTDGSGDIQTFQYALVLDTVLKRWGQIKVDHVDIFTITIGSESTELALTFNDLGTDTFNTLGSKTFNDLIAPNPNVFEPTSKRQLGILDIDGSIKVALLDYNKDFNHEGVAVFGRFQMVRANAMQHQRTTFEGVYGENITSADTFNAYIQPSLDGDNLLAPTLMTTIAADEKSITYGCRKTGLNFNLAVEGTFSLKSMVVEVTNEGDLP